MFLDPDNGLLIKSVSLGSAKSIKYVLTSEVTDYYSVDHSVAFYNHRFRQKESSYVQRFDWLKNEPALISAIIMGLKFIRGSIRDYILLYSLDIRMLFYMR